MAEVLSDYQFRRGAYPDWKQYFDGRIHRLTSGTDFEGDSKKAQSSVYQAAKRNGVKVQSEREGDAVLIVRAVANPE